MDRVRENKKKVVTPIELAESGYRVYNSCLGVNSDNWERDQTQWHAAAAQAHAYIKDCMDAETEVRVPQFARGIFEWLANGNGSYLELSNIVKVAFEAVGRVWWGMMTSEEDIDQSEAEMTGFEWFQSKIARMNGSVHSNNPSLAPPKVELTPEMIAEAQGKSQLETFPVAAPKVNIPKGAMVRSFRAVIAAKIEELMDKAAALEKYAASIPDDADEVLAELFNDIIKPK